jgi:hypothetical protein
MRGGARGLRQEFAEDGVGASALNNEMRALGTTLRYAFAGSVIFGVTSMVRNLSQIQTQLGQIAAIGSQAGGGGSIPLTTSQISNLGSTVRQASVDAITPVNDFNDAVLNLYSTVQNIPPNRAAEMVKEFAKTAKLTQTDVTTLQQVALQSQFAFHRPHTVAEAKRQSQEYFSLISSAPGGPSAAPQIFQQLGPLARIFAFGHGTQEQMLGFTLSALRGGGTPATNLRGLQYLMQTVSSPDEQSKTSKAAFHSLGITDDFIQKHGVAAAMKIVLQKIRGTGVKGASNLRGLDDETLSQIEAQAGDDPFAAMSQLGISGGGAKLAAQLFHRVHALRTAVGLATRSEAGPGVGPTVAQDLKLIQDAADGHVNDVNNLNKAWARFTQQARLPQAAQALASMSIGVATEAERLINYHGVVTGAITKAGEQVNKHPDYALGGILGLGALALRGGRLGLLAGAGRGLGGGAIVAEGLAKGTNVPGGSPTNPLFVFIVGQLSNPFGSRGVSTPGGVVGGAGGAAAETAQVGGRFSRFRAAGRTLGRLALPVSLAYSAYQLDEQLTGSTPNINPLLAGNRVPNAPSHSLLAYLSKEHEKSPGLLRSMFGVGGKSEFSNHPTGGEKGIISLYQSGKISSQEAEARLLNVAHTHPKQWADLLREGVIVIQGKAKVDVNIHEKDASGNTTRTTKKRVSVDLFPDFTPAAPTQRNKKTTRGGR